MVELLLETTLSAFAVGLGVSKAAGRFAFVAASAAKAYTGSATQTC